MRKVRKANACAINLISPAKQDKRLVFILRKRATAELMKERDKMLRKIFHVMMDWMGL